MGNARALANQKETAAWKRLNAAVKVTPGGQVQCLSARDDRTAIPPAPVQQNRTPLPNASPLRGMSGTRQQGRSPLSAVGAGAATMSSYISSPGGPAAVLALGAGANPRSPISTRGSARQRTPNAGMNSARQRSPSPSLSGTPRCASARETRPSAAAAAGTSAEDHAAQAAAAAARRNTMPASPSRPGAGAGPAGLLEAEGIELRAASGQKLLRSEASASEGGRERAPSASPSRADMASQRSVTAAPAVAPAVAASKAIMNVPSSQSSPAETRVGEDGSEPGGQAPGGPPNAATAAAVKDAAATAAAPTTEASPSVRKAASQRVTDGLTVEGSGLSSTAPGSTTTAAAPTISSPAPATSPTVPTAPAANATAPTRIPSLSAGGAPLSSLAGGDGAAAAGPPTNRARATMQGTPRSSIPTLQLKPGPSAAATAAGSATPRLSVPGGIPTFQRTPASAGGAAATSPTPTPPTRASNTWGGAPSATPATSASTVAPNSARSGSSRLPRPTNLSATMPAGVSSSGGGAAAPGASPVGSTTISRSLFASSEADSAIRPASQRPPRLDVTSSTGGTSLAGAAALPTPGGEDAELFSPDADQLEAWAAEAVNAISASVTKKQPQTRSQQQTPPSSQRQDAGAMSGRRKVTQSGSWKSASLGRATDAGSSGGGAKPALGSRIPLSPRHPNSSSNANVNNSQAPSRTPSHGSIGKAMRSPSSSSVGASGGVAASADYSAATPQRAASARSRR